MKKRITLLLCFSILFCFTACGRAAVTESSTSSEPVSESWVERVSMVDGSSFAYTAKVAYANAAGEGYNRILSECLNPEYMYMDSVQHWPLFKFETVQEMLDFKTKYADTLTFESGYNEVPSFNHYAAEYDDAFFGDNTLLLCYVTASSGSYRFGVADVSVREDTLYMYVQQLNHPEVTTADAAGWFVLVEVRKADVENCKHFDAQTYRSDIIDSIIADYDGDGEDEEIIVTIGPTSGLLTIGVKVLDGAKEYSNYSLPEGFYGEACLTEKSGKVYLCSRDGGSVSYEVSVEKGRVVLKNGAQTMRYWGAEPEYAVASFSNLTGARGKHTPLSPEDNQAVAQLIGRQELKESYDNLSDVILRDTLNEYEFYYDSDAGILTVGDSAVKLSDADREALNAILSRYITLGVE